MKRILIKSNHMPDIYRAMNNITTDKPALKLVTNDSLMLVRLVNQSPDDNIIIGTQSICLDKLPDMGFESITEFPDVVPYAEKGKSRLTTLDNIKLSGKEVTFQILGESSKATFDTDYQALKFYEKLI